MTAPRVDAQKAWLGRGWAFPVRVDQLTGSIALSEYEEDIRQSILIILHTAKGERVMRPDFGCGIHDLVFDVVDVAMLTRVETSVRDALTRYEARVEMLGVKADATDAFNGKLVIELEYRVRQTNQVGNLVFPFYYRESRIGAAESSRR